MVKQNKETYMKLDFRQDFANIGEEVIALHIQVYRDISFIPHKFVYFFDLQIDIDPLILLIYFLGKVILLIFLFYLIFFLLRD